DELEIPNEQTATAADTIKLALSDGNFDLILLDLKFPDCTDLSTLTELRRQIPQTDIIIVTAETDDLALVREAARCGIYDYVPKPIRENDIKIRVTRALEMRALAKTCQRAIDELACGSEIGDIIGQTPAVTYIKQQITQLGDHDLPVLILGETGTGKELIAHALHYSSKRRKSPFVSVNCAAIPQTLIESELFGHERGAFTGAVKSRAGAFSRAEDGTIFLDEIGDMNIEGQSRLLRVLEDGVFDTVGGKTETNRARVILATNHNLERLVEEQKFRKDLFYRIDRLRITTPPLRERGEDIRLLANHFLSKLNAKVGKGITEIPDNIINAMLKYQWPGNIRELRNEIERLYIMATGTELQSTHLSPSVLESTLQDTTEAMSLNSIRELENLLAAINASNGVINETAKILGVHRNTVSRWMKKYGLADSNQD
ncbi:MAG: sigma-54-dependent Fis family transcriptional regulator, partial [Planctomycetes bacterium]|nr:sigma-54-dependent Fis family transcriptional regulator [Planctomycetota bacterium]